jgi:hypothetical protein
VTLVRKQTIWQGGACEKEQDAIWSHIKLSKPKSRTNNDRWHTIMRRRLTKKDSVNFDVENKWPENTIDIHQVQDSIDADGSWGIVKV